MRVNAMITEHERIALTTDVPAKHLQHGDVGTVISVHGGGEAYTVEFLTVGGRTFAIATLLASQLRAVAPEELQQTRPLVAV
jgi:hypothetical protein